MALQDQVKILECVKGHLSQRDQGFASSLIDQHYSRGLSEKQAVWIAELTKRATGEGPKAASIGSVKGVIDLLERAQQHLKWPKLLVRVNGRDLCLQISGPASKSPGTISVASTERAYEDRTWYGRITREGVYEPSQSRPTDTTTAIASALRALARDPAKVASEYGRLTGACCFCALPLTDARSTAVGYGRICAQHWGLPWGAK
jgi:hypothetical protein